MNILSSFAVSCAVCAAGVALAADYPLRAIDKNDVRVTRGFWFDRIETNRTMTLKANWAKCNETPRIANFTNAAARAIGTFGGIPFDDSDVFKVMEGTAYVLAAHPDRELERYQNGLIGMIARAQEPDGYLYTARTLGHYALHCNEKGWHTQMMGPTRWSKTGSSHELYNNGHMIEAAVAWYEATGNRNFLSVARKSADLFDRTFGPAPTQLKCIPGHEEIELALVKLYRVTNERRYLDLARFFLETRGRGVKLVDGVPAGADGKPVANIRLAPGVNVQNHMPVADQREAVGHAVRAAYLYCAMADVAALTGERRYADAIAAIWENVVTRKLHLHGGIGASPAGEAFAANYVLPNDWGKTYDETCAQIGSILWNQRMFLSAGEAKYVDVMERTLYNGFLSGVSLAGDTFFYPNPLAAKAGYKRSKWFGCSCCPVNIVRMVPQVASLSWAEGKGAIYWNLFLEGTARIGGFDVSVKTDYPWTGRVELTVAGVTGAAHRKLKVRIPGWAVGRPVPSDLYVQTEPASFGDVSVAVNGSSVDACPGADGYVDVERDWTKGDRLDLDFPMQVKRIRAHGQVEADRGRMAVERGPLVYCAEGFDNGGKAYDAALPPEATFAEDRIGIGDKTFQALKASTGLKLIPYCLWGNRTPGNELQTWFRVSSDAR